MTGTPDAIGLDIGGTTLKAVRLDAAGRCLQQTTLAAGGAIAREQLLSAVDRAVVDVGGLSGIERIGISVGGVVRADGSMPADATNLPNLAGLPLRQLFSERFGLPCTVINDAHAALHGEAWCGAAQGLRQVLMVTFGTGIGGAIMTDGHVRKGARGMAGEIGVWPVVDQDGRTQAFEDVAAPVRFERRYGVPFATALSDPDPRSQGKAALRAIGSVLASAHVLLDLEAIILGGGIVAVGEPFRAAIEAEAWAACPAPYCTTLDVRLGSLGPYAGAIGAVVPGAPGALL